jgi:hypothetical protein
LNLGIDVFGFPISRYKRRWLAIIALLGGSVILDMV